MPVTAKVIFFIQLKTYYSNTPFHDLSSVSCIIKVYLVRRLWSTDGWRQSKYGWWWWWSLNVYFTTLSTVPDGRPSIQCHLTELLTGRAWAAIQTGWFCIRLYESLTMNCWNTLSTSSSVMIGSVEFSLSQNSLASSQLNTELLV